METYKSSMLNWLESVAGRDNLWIVEVFFLVFASLFLATLVSRFLSKVLLKTQSNRTFWDDALFESLLGPAKWLILLLGLSFAAEVVAKHSDSFIFENIKSLRYVSVVALGTWFLTGFVRRVEQRIVNPEYCKEPMDQTTAMALGKLVRMSVLITSTLVVLQTLGFSISGVLAFGGIGGIAVGFAAKDILANFFGGLMIFLDRPFAVGDWVRSPDKNIEGTVENIGWRLTRIRTFDKRPLYVPNATFAQISLENPSRMTNRRIYETIGIRYNDGQHMGAIIKDVKAMLLAHEEIDTSQTLIVNFNAFASSSLDFFVYCFTKTTNWIAFHEIKQDVLLKVLEIIENHGAECAFPTSTVHLPDDVKVMLSSDKLSSDK